MRKVKKSAAPKSVAKKTTAKTASKGSAKALKASKKTTLSLKSPAKKTAKLSSQKKAGKKAAPKGTLKAAAKKTASKFVTKIAAKTAAAKNASAKKTAVKKLAAKKPVAKKTAPKASAFKPATKSMKAPLKAATKTAKPSVGAASKKSHLFTKKADAPKSKSKLFAKKVPEAANHNAQDEASDHETAHPGLEAGAHVPEFTMPATVLGEVSSESLKGKPFVLYFYPKDDTPGCTAQACGFRDAVPELDKLGLTVVGISKDDIQSHEKFSSKYDLSFPLASDQSHVSEAFGTWKQKSMYGKNFMGIERSTFLVDGEGVVRAVWRKVNVEGHVEEVKKAIANL